MVGHDLGVQALLCHLQKETERQRQRQTETETETNREREREGEREREERGDMVNKRTIHQEKILF